MGDASGGCEWGMQVGDVNGGASGGCEWGM